MRTATVAAVTAGLIAQGLAAGHAQVIQGTVIDESTRQGIDGVEVTLSDDSDTRLNSTVTDSTGAFRLELDSAGTYALRTEHIGYATSDVDSLDIGATEEVEVELSMGTEAIPMNPLHVVARRPGRFGRLAEYYDRLEWTRKTGFGSVITRQEIESRFASQTTDLLRTEPSIRIGGRSNEVLITRGGGCTPAIFIDGVHMNRQGEAIVDDYVHPSSIEGIEIYRGVAGAPVQYQDRRGCGSILIWTRQGEPSDEPFSWLKLVIGGAGFAALLLLLK